MWSFLNGVWSTSSGRDTDTSTQGGNLEASRDGDDENERGNWGSQWEFVFSCIGTYLVVGNKSSLFLIHFIIRRGVIS